MASVERLLKDLRGLVVSMQGGLTVGQLKRDYQEIFGCSLAGACSSLGYGSVEALIAEHPRELRIQNGTVYATIKEKTSQIQKLVNEQQRKKVKSRGGRQFSRPRPMSAALPRTATYSRIPPPPHFLSRNPPPRFVPKDPPPLMTRTVEVDINARKPWPKELFVDSERSSMPRQNNFAKQTLTNYLKPKERQDHDKFRCSNASPDLSETGGDIFREIPSLDATEVVVSKVPEMVSNKKSEHGVQMKTDKISAVRLQEVNGTGEPKEDVHSYLVQVCTKLGYGKPEYRVSSLNQHGKQLWLGMVRAGGEIFRSDAVESQTTARHLAGSTAYTRLSARLAGKSLPQPDVNQPIKTNLEFLTELLELLTAKHSNGIWTSSVPQIYEEKYGKPAPNDWKALLKNNPKDFWFDELFGIELLKAVPKTAAHAPASTNTQAKNEVILPPSPPKFFDVSAELPLKKTIPEIELKENDVLDLHVLSFVGHDAVIVRLIDDDFETKLSDINTAMEIQLMDKKCKLVDSPVVGNYYAVCCSEMIIVRGILKSIEPGGMAVVYDIDGGEREKVPLSSIYELEDKFCNLESQALHFRLDGLMNFPRVDNLPSLMEPLTRKPYVGIVRWILENNESRGIIELYDTSKDPNVNLNQALMEDVVSQLPPIAMEPDSVYQLKLSVVEDNAVYVQCMDSSVDCITSLIEYIAERNNLVDHKVKKILCDKIYFAWHPKIGKLRRIRVTGFAEKLEVLFIDYGDSAELDRDDVFDLPSASLSKVPARACKVAITNLDAFTPSQVNFMKSKLIGKEMMVKTKAVSDIPHVELYWREPTQALMQSVTKVLKSLPDSTATVLPELTIPKVNSQMYVTVVLSLNPSSFKVLVKDDIEILDKFMNELQEVGLDALPVPEVENLKTGEYYAVESNNFWFRGKLLTILGDDELSILLVDEGEIVILSRDKLRVLPVEFLEYPVYLRQATLHGVRAAAGDWLPPDCVNFQNWLAQKELFAIVKDVTFLEDDTPVLALQLVDTTDPDKDVFVHEQLIKEGIAVADI